MAVFLRPAFGVGLRGYVILVGRVDAEEILDLLASGVVGVDFGVGAEARA